MFDGPALIRRADVTRHVWGDPAAGEVYDWIYASTDKVHMLVFGLAPGTGFRHSPDFRTIFAADELLHVLQGVLVIADPETGEVQRAGAGESVFFRRDTWHHAFAIGPEPLRVPWPAPSKTSLQIASIRRTSTPGRMAAIARSFASSMVSKSRRTRSDGVPITMVRSTLPVYPQTIASRTLTRTSPSSTTLFGPKLRHSEWPALRSGPPGPGVTRNA